MIVHKLAHITPLFFGLLVTCVLAASVSIAALGTNSAFADEGDNDDATSESTADNTVNTQQLPDSSFIYETDISELATADTYYDGQEMQVTGEVVGDELTTDTDKNYRWITLASDDGNATLSVYIPVEAAEKIDSFGSYAATGTTLQVYGTFNLACADHAGGTDLHAETATVVSAGSAHQDTYDFNDFIPGIIVVGIGVALLLLFYWARERRR